MGPTWFLYLRPPTGRDLGVNGQNDNFSGELKNSLAADSGKKFQKCHEGKNRNLAKQV